MASDIYPTSDMDQGLSGPVVINRPMKGLPSLNLHELWIYRYLLFYIVRRDIVVRYKQTVFGISWAAINPLITMVVFSFVFGALLNVDTSGVPYPLFSLAALVPWAMFAKGLSNSSVSIQSNSNIITKIYFPRIIAPISAFTNSFIDFVVSLAVLLLMILGYVLLAPDLIGVVPPDATPEVIEAASQVRIFGPGPVAILMLPLFILLVVMFGLGLGFWFSALQVRMRDINYIIPFVLQIGQYVTPVAYASNMIETLSGAGGEVWQFLYGLNPMVTAIDGFRWAFFNLDFSPVPTIIASVSMCLFVFFSGLYFFRYSESKFVDYL
ncbi:MAG: phosphate ABC transporter permease [Anaerolineaceae bacterium]|nr:phosphate ABC transporter permease [Anaerolineaceae bacterium]